MTDLSAEIKNNLNQYNREIQENLIKETDSIVKALRDDLRRESPKRRGTKLRGKKGGKRYAPGSYAKSWTVRTSKKSFSVYIKEVYNRNHYQLTHLLEKGHEARNGSRVAPVEHIAPLDRKAVNDYEHKVIKLIKSIK